MRVIASILVVLLLSCSVGNAQQRPGGAVLDQVIKKDPYVVELENLVDQYGNLAQEMLIENEALRGQLLAVQKDLEKLKTEISEVKPKPKKDAKVKWLGAIIAGLTVFSIFK